MEYFGPSPRASCPDPLAAEIGVMTKEQLQRLSDLEEQVIQLRGYL